MENIVGPIAENDDFFPREVFINRLWKRLAKHSLILSAPRRSGKSSVLTEMKNNTSTEYSFVYFNVEGASSEIEYFKILVDSLEIYGLLESKWHKGVLEYFDGIETKHITFRKNDFSIRKFINDLSSNLKSDRLIVIAIDEFSTFLAKLLKSDEEKAKDFLDINRQLRQDEKIRKRFRFIYTGSVGLENIVEKLNYSKSINDLDSMPLKPFSKNESKEFLEKLFEHSSMSADDGTVSYIIEKVEWLMPFFIQIIFKHIEENCSDCICTKEVVDSAYESIFDLSNKKHFSHWQERLGETYSNKEKLFLLEVLSFTAKNIKSDFLDIENIKADYDLEATTRHYINLLEYDGYIVKDAENYRFVSPILREWWIRNA